MQSASSRSSLTPVDTNLPTTEGWKANPHVENEKPVLSNEADLLGNMSKTLQHILGLLRSSSIAEEHSKDMKSKFWATYKKVADEYDDDFLQRAHGDIGVILTFAGLLSAVISTFIGGMQPDSGVTTNALLVQLIQVTVDGPSAVHNINNLSSVTHYSSLIIWVETLAYISLALSILAAFGAVVGKQCLYSYEAARKQGGSLEESGTRRQMRLDGLEYLQLRAWLQAFLGLLQVALLLFSVSLCLKTWSDHLPTFGFMVCATASVTLFYIGTIFLLAWWQDSPVQIPGTELARAIGEFFCRAMTISSTSTQTPVESSPVPNKSSPIPNKSSPVSNKSSPICWILETSTDQEAVQAAVAMVPHTQWSPNTDVSSAFQRLRDNFEACRDTEELYVNFGKAMAHLCTQPVKIETVLVNKPFWHEEFQPTRSRFIRDAFTACRDAYSHLNNKTPPPEEDVNGLKLKHRASARAALRTMVVHGLKFCLSLPDSEKLIWSGNLCWSHSDGRKPNCEEFDWLVDYLADEVGYDKADETGDALLALSAMCGLGSPAKRCSYIESLVRSMEPGRPSRVRHAALRTVHDARGELASITSSSMQGINAELIDDLSRTLSTIIPQNGADSDASLKYIHIMFAMTKNDKWCQRLADHNHLQLCISLVNEIQMYDRDVGFYFTVIIGRFYLIGKDLPSDSVPVQGRLWSTHIKNTWQHAYHNVGNDDYINGIPALVKVTRSNIVPGAPRRSADIAKKVQLALADLQSSATQAALKENGVAQDALDAAISSVEDLCNYLRSTVEQPEASQM